MPGARKPKHNQSKWNQVTSSSKIAAVVLLIILPILAFYTAFFYQKIARDIERNRISEAESRVLFEELTAGASNQMVLRHFLILQDARQEFKW